MNYRLGRFDEALIAFERSRRLKGDELNIDMPFHAMTLSQLGRVEEAHAVIAPWLAANPRPEAGTPAARIHAEAVSVLGLTADR